MAKPPDQSTLSSLWCISAVSTEIRAADSKKNLQIVPEGTFNRESAVAQEPNRRRLASKWVVYSDYLDFSESSDCDAPINVRSSYRVHGPEIVHVWLVIDEDKESGDESNQRRYHCGVVQSVWDSHFLCRPGVSFESASIGLTDLVESDPNKCDGRNRCS